MRQLRQAGLIAGGTALALAATVSTGTAAGAAAPGSGPGVEWPKAAGGPGRGGPSVEWPKALGTDGPPGLTGRVGPAGPGAGRPRIEARIPRAPTATAAAARAKPRLDLDYDGYSEIFEQGYRHDHIVYLTSSGQSGSWYAIDRADPEETFVDVVPTGDLGGEELTDIATVSSDGRLTVYTALLDRTTRPRWTGRGWQVYNRVMGAGDLTRDGRPDLLARTHSGELYLYKGTGKISTAPFAGRVKVGSGWGIYDQVVTVNDADGDTIGDLVARSLDGVLWFYKGTGSAGAPFKPRVKIGKGWNAYNQIIGADDMNDDGRGDLLARKPDGKLVHYLSTGGGKFAAPVHFGSGWYYAQFLAGAGTTHLYGRAELLAVTTDDQWYKHINLYNGTLEGSSLGGADPGTGTTWGYATAMHNRDHASVLLVQGKKLTINDRVASTSWNHDVTVGPGDLTGDGKGDLLARDRSGTLWLYPGDGAFESSLGTRVKVGTGWQGYDALFGSGDYSGDGRPDLLARDRTGKVFLFPGTGKATAPLGTRVQVGTGWQVYERLVTTGDLTGDAKGDVLGVNAAGELMRVASTGKVGSGLFAKPVRIDTEWTGIKHLF
ncbi:FG-GAP-like repeat-containing protein [Streptomyces sp. NPDC097619]|uniref:FG-GAP-like repeat-containing protein n=1 Tax=Streptomyces sp. NPDC097619 TaxID=3157228 RepID=UPI00333250F9